MNQISFFKTHYLLALAFIGIVVLIHFLKRPKTDNIKFSTLRFFDTSAVRSRKNRNLRKILLLILRCAAIAVIVMLFAEPFNPKYALNKLHNPDTPVYFWVDHTPSMSYKDDLKSIGQISYDIIDSLRKILPSSSNHFFFDPVFKEFVPKEKNTLFSSNFNKLDFETALDQLTSGAFKTDPVLILFTDFQEPLTNILEEKLPALGRNITVVCVPVTPSKPWNYSLSILNVMHKDKLEVEAKLHANGKTVQNGEVVAIVNNMRIGRESVKVAEDDSTIITFKNPYYHGNVDGYISLLAHDPLQFDNVSWFIPKNRENRRITVVGDTLESMPIVYALNAASHEIWKNLKLVNSSKVSFDDLDSADLVIINNYLEPSRALDAFLSDKTASKKPILFCCNVEDRKNAWSTGLISAMFPSINHIEVKEFKTSLSPVLYDTISELWQNFQNLRIEDVSINKIVSGIKGDVMLELTDGTPLLVKSKDKNGRTWLFVGTPIGIPDANNLSESGFFVPFIDRICRFLLLSNQIKTDNVYAGQVHKNPYFGSNQVIAVFDNNAKLIKTIQSDQPYFTYENPGLYKMVPQKGESFRVAVQADPSESNLKYYQPKPKKIRNVDMVIADGNSFIILVSNRGYVTLMNAAWILLIILLIAEIFLWESNKPSSK